MGACACVAAGQIALPVAASREPLVARRHGGCVGWSPEGGEEVGSARDGNGWRTETIRQGTTTVVSMTACYDALPLLLNAVGAEAEDVPSARLRATLWCVGCWPGLAVGRLRMDAVARRGIGESWW